MKFLAGIFTDGTKSACVILDEDKKVVGEAYGKTINLAYPHEVCWENLISVVEAASKRSKKKINLSDIELAAGVKSIELTEKSNKLSSRCKKVFSKHKLLSDGFVAYNAVFDGTPGILIIVDEGVVAYTLINDQFERYGGWGFPHADDGGTAWIGLQAIHHTFRVCDKLDEASMLSEAILKEFNNSANELCEHAMQGLPAWKYAELANYVFTLVGKDQKSDGIIEQAKSIIYKQLEEINDKHPGKQFKIYFEGKLSEILSAGFPKSDQLVKHRFDYLDKAKAALELLGD